MREWLPAKGEGEKYNHTRNGRLGCHKIIHQWNYKKQLGLRVRQQLDISLADGTKRKLDVAGPVRLRFKDRNCITDAFVLSGDEEPLIGAVAMELMDLVIIPAENKLYYNPNHPDGPLYSLK